MMCFCVGAAAHLAVITDKLPALDCIASSLPRADLFTDAGHLSSGPISLGTVLAYAWAVLVLFAVLFYAVPVVLFPRLACGVLALKHLGIVVVRRDLLRVVLAPFCGPDAVLAPLALSALTPFWCVKRTHCSSLAVYVLPRKMHVPL